MGRVKGSLPLDVAAVKFDCLSIVLIVPGNNIMCA